MAQINIPKDAFNMTSNPSGYCVIIDVNNFDGNSENERNTSIESINLMRETFEYLNFEVIIWTNLKDFQIKSRLNEIFNSEERDSYDCFVLYIHSHRKEGFITANNNVIKYHEIYEMFSNAKCKKFIGEPELALLDCCRGEFSQQKSMLFFQVNKAIKKKYHYLTKQQVSGSAKNLLYNFERPTKLNLESNEIKYLNDVLNLFSNENKYNSIEIDEQYFGLNDERYQCIKDGKFVKRFNNDHKLKILEKMNDEIKNVCVVKSPFRKLIIEGSESDFEKIKKEFPEILEKNQTTFCELVISNPKIESITSNSFKNFSFNEIKISESSKKLNYIERDAFGNCAKQVRCIEILNNLPANLSSEKLIEFLNYFTNIKEIIMKSPNKLEGQLELSNLKYLIIDGSNSIRKLELIDDFVFFKCDNLTYINLSNNEISKITPNILCFEKTLNKLLTLDLSNNKLNEMSFDELSFSKMNRPVKLILNKNQIKYLNINAFKEFFNGNNKNIIHLYGDTLYNGFEYGNTKNEWLFKDENILNKKLFGIENLVKCIDNVFINKKREEILIIGKNNFHIKSAFTKKIQNKLNKFSYKILKVENGLIDIIDENSFAKFKFKEIQITNCPKLKRIHKNSFGKNSKNIKKFYALNGLYNLSSKPRSDFDLIELINNLVNCEKIMITSFGKTIYSIKLKNLEEIIFDGEFSSLKIETIENDTFYLCDKIKLINLRRNQIKTIKANAFRLKNQRHDLLKIDLSNNSLDESSFELTQFKYIKRPIKLCLKDNNIINYEEEIFNEFFKNKLNQIVIKKDQINLNKKANKWLNKYEEQIVIM